ncbi:UNVERIFIED_ORG: putative Holliday junction resolvase-like endonuclease [Heyndrickxia coagulans]
MMVWTLVILFAVSVVLLIMSIFKTRNRAKEEQQELETVHLALMDEINHLKDGIRTLELEMEILEKEAGIQLSAFDKQFRLEVLDLYKRNYSIESIAEKKQVTKAEIEEILAPFMAAKNERSKVAGGNE